MASDYASGKFARGSTARATQAIKDMLATIGWEPYGFDPGRGRVRYKRGERCVTIGARTVCFYRIRPAPGQKPGGVMKNEGYDFERFNTVQANAIRACAEKADDHGETTAATAAG